VTPASEGTLNTARQDEDAARATSSAGRPGSLGQSAPEQQTHALADRLGEAISRSGQLRSQSVSVFARLAVTYAELADLAEGRALKNRRNVERMKAMSVTARDRSIDCRQLVIEKSQGGVRRRAGELAVQAVGMHADDA
jgi:hypothetical protein